MNITVIGSGYVGLVSATCLAEIGNKVICVDVNAQKIEKLKQGIVPIFEPGLEEIIFANIAKKKLMFTTHLEKALADCDIAFIAVGTPMGEDGSADLQYVLEVAESIGQYVDSKLIVVNKSTVPVGTGRLVKNKISEILEQRKCFVDVHVVSNPEFLREGSAIQDFMSPDRIVIGIENDYAELIMKQLYMPVCKSNDCIITMDIESAEMTKYTANAMLATKISFINEIASICEEVGADISHVRLGIGSDHRIGYSFINPGIGYGGSCFPKDVKALVKIAQDNGYEPQLISAVEKVNHFQRFVICKKITKRFGEDLTGFTFGIWGLAFKPDTDDMREAPSIYIIKELLQRGAKLQVYDPKAIDEAKYHYFKGLNNISYYNSKYQALTDTNALILLTEWEEFKSLNLLKIESLLKEKIVFDGRNLYEKLEWKDYDFEYYRIGKK